MREVFNSEFDFCSPFRPARAYYTQHLAQYPRFKVNGMNQCFFLVPDSHYGLNSQAFNDILHLPHVGFPLLPLPLYVRGLMKIVLSDRNAHNFRVQLEYLIDGMDIDEEWCDSYLDGFAKECQKQEHAKREGVENGLVRSMMVNFLLIYAMRRSGRRPLVLWGG